MALNEAVIRPFSDSLTQKAICRAASFHQRHIFFSIGVKQTIPCPSPPSSTFLLVFPSGFYFIFIFCFCYLFPPFIVKFIFGSSFSSDLSCFLFNWQSLLRKLSQSRSSYHIVLYILFFCHCSPFFAFPSPPPCFNFAGFY